jgi:hypothetical protein
MLPIKVMPITKIILFIPIMVFSSLTFSQTRDTSTITGHMSAYVGVTNNGISFIPTFSFDKPSGTVIFSAGNRRLSFEPDFRFTLDMQRGGMAFWWRYKVITKEKFKLDVGAHPALKLDPAYDEITGKATGTLEAQRYIAGEIAPNYFLTKNVSIGLYYLYGHGFQDSGPINAHFFTINSSISNIPLFAHLILQFIPQLYYLAVDNEDGYYFTNTLTIARSDFPLMIQSTQNASIHSNITGSKDFQWNVTLVYFFHKEFKAMK